MKLSKSAIDRLQATHKDAFLWDSELPGFGVRCNTHSRKTFVLRYRTVTGQQRMQMLARCVDMPLVKARELARDVLGKVRSGTDPMHDRQAARRQTTLGELYERYITSYAAAYNRPSTVEGYRYLWLRLKPWASRGLLEISRADVLELHASLHAHPIGANRCVAMLSKMYNCASDWELVPAGTNPARRIRKYPERIRERVLSRLEVKALLHELDEPHTKPWLRLLGKLLLATGCRLGELRDARMEWVDWEQGLLLLPRSKTGQRSIALSDAALRLLEERRGEEWMIASGRNGQPAKQVQAAWRRMVASAGLPGVTPHTLRHTVGTLGHAAGLSQREIADLLGHKHLVTTQRYLHGFSSRTRINAGKVADLMGL